jgi:xanthine dehydrogenase iron-sulfur cluster and FAD-binding subunit A
VLSRNFVQYQAEARLAGSARHHEAEFHCVRRIRVHFGLTVEQTDGVRQIMSAVGFLAERRRPSDEDIREGMSGNLCRCGAYPNIVDAIRDVSEGRG